MKWYQNKYIQAAGVAAATGLVTAIILGLHLLTQPISTKEYISEVGLAFMAPFGALVALLPRVSEILIPTVRIVSQERVAQLAAARPETSITTNDVDTTVVFGEPPVPPSPNAAVINTQSYTPARRTREGNSIPVKSPPVKLT